MRLQFENTFDRKAKFCPRILAEKAFSLAATKTAFQRGNLKKAVACAF
jgi:hypothetical protein